jgi:ATP-dependent exoDNAse (exonuclease V) alpha subunit
MDSKQSWFITGPGGSGKTTLIKDLQKKLNEQKLKYMSLCPTNLAALLVGGMTIHKFSARLKKSSNVKNLDLDYIFIDEVSMMQEVFYKFLMMIKKIKPEIKYIISGDYNQLKPVNDRISQYTDYSNAPCLFELADFNKIQLTKCRRADDKLYKLIQFNNVPNLKTSDFKETKDYNNNINLCFTNEKRKEINDIKMRALNAKNHWKGGIKLKALPYDKCTQDVILHKGVPIISKVNSEEMDLVNNQRFVITKVGSMQITIQDDSRMERDIFNHEFQKYFLVAYATTIHCPQGCSIGNNYTIHEWDRLDEKLKYVALSRARDHELIHIMK